jgi:alginate O-acetyltransferase complex protein AlgI
MITPIFFLFLLFVSVIYWLLPIQKSRNIFLSIASLGFISYFDKFATLLVIVLTLNTYWFGFLIERKRNKKLFHVIGIIGIMTTLVFFKYFGLLQQTVNAVTGFLRLLPAFEIKKILLPLGISYITFKHISYLTDIKWGKIEKGLFVDFFCYSSLFTIFVAGPIERFEKFNPQISKQTIQFQTNYVSFAFRRIIFGLFKKLVIANWIGYFINPLWNEYSELNITLKLVILFGYSIQIYMDFAGYSDIAIGSSKLFGLKIMENFNWPYLQPNISQFWRHWHISLSEWFKDYLYFPLGGSRNGLKRTIFNVIIVFMLCGFWHGQEWHFVIWGLWHGIGISIFQLWNYYTRKNKKLSLITNKDWFILLSRVSTFLFVTFGWWWFR